MKKQLIKFVSDIAVKYHEKNIVNKHYRKLIEYDEKLYEALSSHGEREKYWEILRNET